MSGISMGDHAKDVISGFEGVVDSIHYYLNGCVRVGLNPRKLGTDGKLLEPHIFDVNQIVPTGGNIRDELPAAQAVNFDTEVPGPGGPFNDPPRAQLPPRM